MNTEKADDSVTATVVPSKKRETKKYVLIGIITIIVASLAFYFLYFIKTPVYSLYEIRTAVQTKNLVLLEERVDLKSVYSSAFDDYVSLSIDDSKSMSNPLAVVMAKFIKPTIIDTLVEKTKIAIKNGELDKSIQQANQKETKTSNLPEESTAKEKTKTKTSGIENLKVTGIKGTEIEGNTAVVSVEVLDRIDNNNKVIIVDLKMKKLSDGTWQLVKIDNFKETFKVILKEAHFPSFDELVK